MKHSIHLKDWKVRHTHFNSRQNYSEVVGAVNLQPGAQGNTAQEDTTDAAFKEEKKWGTLTPERKHAKKKTPKTPETVRTHTRTHRVTSYVNVGHAQWQTGRGKARKRMTVSKARGDKTWNNLKQWRIWNKVGMIGM